MAMASCVSMTIGWSFPTWGLGSRMNHQQVHLKCSAYPLLEANVSADHWHAETSLIAEGFGVARERGGVGMSRQRALSDQLH
jgi:hypothetical protein